MDTKMTKREVLCALMTEEEREKHMEDIILWAEEELAKMDKANEARKAKISKKAAENMPLMDKIYEDILDEEEPVTATVVGEHLEISTQKASALLRKMVTEGRATVEDVKIPKKGTQKGYTKVA